MPGLKRPLAFGLQFFLIAYCGEGMRTRSQFHGFGRSAGRESAGRRAAGAYGKEAFAIFMCAVLLLPGTLLADMVPVRYLEGLMHGFLELKTLDGKTIADGEITQRAQDNRVTDRLSFQFRDGSTYEDTTTFSQRGTFRLLSDHVIQKGPSFKQPSDTLIDASTGQVTIRSIDDGGKTKIVNEHIDLPPDISNGLLFTMLKDIKPGGSQTTVSMVVATPKPRLVKLIIVREGEEPVSIGRFRYKAMRYAIKVQIGGVTGFMARLTGKQPPDTHVWILEGDAPAFVKSEGPLFAEGPVWRIQLAGAALF
jgi:hypothetical protein